MAQSILIVDDERDIVSMLNQYFCKIGYVVYTAINGKEALNAITKHPDIILLVNNPVPVSLLSGDRKPQIRFLGNHHSGSGNPYHKSFRM